MSLPRWLAAALAASVALAGCGTIEKGEGFASVPESKQGSEGPLRSGATIELKDIAFAPRQVRVRVGATVTWVNGDRVAHTVTRGSELYNDFDSGDVEPGQSFSRAFDEPGEARYRCTIHANMEGTLRVERGRRTPSSLAPRPEMGAQLWESSE